MNVPEDEAGVRPKLSVRKNLTIPIRLALAATVLASAASAASDCSQVLIQPGLNLDTQPLLPFNQGTLDRWMQENAVLVSSPDGGVSASAGDGMVRIETTGGGVSEVRQRVDVSAMATKIDAGIVCMEARGMINPTVSGVDAGTLAFAFDSVQGQVGIVASPCRSPDGNIATWEQSIARLLLPSGTRFVEMRFFATNSTLPAGQFLYADEGRLELYEVVEPQALTDPGLNSNAQPLLPFNQGTLDRWMQENATLVVGPANGVTPFAGDGMVCLATTSLSASEVRQRVDVSTHSADIDAGLMTLETRGWVNPTVSGVTAGVTAFAFDAFQTQLGVASSPCPTPDGDKATWQEAIASLCLPAGTRFVEMRFFATNSTLPAGEFLYGDEATLTLKGSPVCFVDVCPGLAGTPGFPVLSAQVSLGPNAVGDLKLTNGLPLTTTALFIGLGPAGPGVNFKGGILKPAPWLLLLVGLPTDVNGNLTIPLTTGLNHSGLSIVFQYALVDSGAIQGISLSNALQLDYL